MSTWSLRRVGGVEIETAPPPARGSGWILPLLAFLAVTLLPFVIVALMADELGDDLATANAYVSATTSLTTAEPETPAPPGPQQGH